MHPPHPTRRSRPVEPTNIHSRFRRVIHDWLPACAGLQFKCLSLALFLLLGATPIHAGQESPSALHITTTADTLAIEFSCPQPAPVLLVSLDTTPVPPQIPGPPVPLPPAEQHGDQLFSPGAIMRFSLPTAALPPGPHQLSISGCGDPLIALFTMPARRPPLWPLGLIAVLTASAAAGWIIARWRFLRSVPGPGASAASLPSPGEITTARRALRPAEPARLRAIIWDGRQQRASALYGRQWSLGADASCDLCVADAALAPLQARLSLVGEQIEVTALAPGVFHTGLGCPLPLDQATPLSEGEALLLGTSVRLTIENP
jgi:hypothetical protein